MESDGRAQFTPLTLTQEGRGVIIVYLIPLSMTAVSEPLRNT